MGAGTGRAGGGRGVSEANVATHLARMAADRRDALAIAVPVHGALAGRDRYARTSYGALDAAASEIAAGLGRLGIGKGSRVALMVPPRLELFELVFALFRAGAVPVMIDPGIGLPSLAACLGRARPTAFVGVPRAHAARVALGWARGSNRTNVVVGPRAFAAAFGASTLDEVRAAGRGAPAPKDEVGPDDEAAVLFTSGSTGVPKGAVYRHRNFVAQVEAIRAMYDIRPGEVDLPTFPLFALFDPALGMTTVVPDMDATRPASVEPAKIAAAVSDFGVTNMFGSPALLDTVSRWAAPRGHVFSTLRRVISAGAPVAPRILARFARCLPPGARIHTPYGATESLPIASIDHVEVLGETQAETARGRGICVGRPVPSARVEIIRVEDAPVPRWDDALRVGRGEVGEITVGGPQVTTHYERAPEETARHKIRVGAGDAEPILHRTGDVGYLDARGRLWYCGRKSHRVETERGPRYTEMVEGPFNAHPDVRRTALVPVPRAKDAEPVLCVELEPGTSPDDARRVVEELRAIGAAHEACRDVERFLVHEGPFPVDIRHNAKIGREKLAAWARQRLGR